MCWGAGIACYGATQTVTVRRLVVIIGLGTVTALLMNVDRPAFGCLFSAPNTRLEKDYLMIRSLTHAFPQTCTHMHVDTHTHTHMHCHHMTQYVIINVCIARDFRVKIVFRSGQRSGADPSFRLSCLPPGQARRQASGEGTDKSRCFRQASSCHHAPCPTHSESTMGNNSFYCTIIML